MRDYRTADHGSNHRERHADCPRTEDLQARLDRTYWRNPNYTDGRYARYRSRLEHRLERWMPIAVDVVRALSPLNLVGVDPVRVLELKRAILAAHPGHGWALTDPCFRVRGEKHRTSLYLPRRVVDKARLFLRLVREGARLVGLRVTRGGFIKAKGSPALPSFTTPTPPPEKKVSHPYPDGERNKEREPERRATSEELRAVLDRIGRRFFGGPPHDAM